MTIRLIAMQTSSVWKKDHPPVKELDVGDVVLIRQALTNQIPQFGKRKGALVGHESAVVTRIGDQVRIVGKDTLPGGTLTHKGVNILYGPPTVFRVTGGTGKFANASGTMTARPRMKDNVRVYRLQLP